MGFGVFARKSTVLPCLVVATLIGTQAAADAAKKPRRQHHAHEHGAAKLHVAIEGKQALIEFQAPAESFFGFEHAPKNDKEKKLVADILKDLKSNPGQYFKFDQAFACTFDKTAARHEFEGKSDDKDSKKSSSHGHDHGHGHAKSSDKKKADSHHGEHSDVHVRTLATCKKELKDSSITIGLFNKFSGIKRIDAQILSRTTQKAATLNAKNASVTF